MPELPDVQIFKQYFDATSLHKEIADIVECDGNLLEGISRKKLSSLLKGNSFEETSRHGKYLFARFEAKKYLVLHFGMTGFLRAYKDEAKGPGHIRLLLRFTDGFYLAYDDQRKLGQISITEDVDTFVTSSELGPDALELCCRRDEFADRLRNHRGMIKTLLMNQKVIAGIGNVYADEILFQSGIHPKTDVKQLDEEQRRSIVRKTCHTLDTAIKKRVGENGWPRSWLLPRREKGKPCPRCSGQIERITVSGRGTYYCAKHQV